VFAFSGLQTDLNIIPDYRDSLELVYTKTATEYLSKHRDLDILCIDLTVHSESDEWPSWVPDYNRKALGTRELFEHYTSGKIIDWQSRIPTQNASSSTTTLTLAELSWDSYGKP
jgi:hypothetical protein